MGDNTQFLLIGLGIGCIPTFTMISASLFAVNIKSSPLFESCSQYLSSGLLIGVVAKELFPVMESYSSKENTIGLTIGFLIGIIFFNTLDYAVSLCDCNDHDDDDSDSNKYEDPNRDDTELVVKRFKSYDSTSLTNNALTNGSNSNVNHITNSNNSSDVDSDMEVIDRAEDIESHPLFLLATQAVSSPHHRVLVQKKMQELVDAVIEIEKRAENLSVTGGGSSNLEVEISADRIDEAIHKLQYNIDHCKRSVVSIVFTSLKAKVVALFYPSLLCFQAFPRGWL